MLGQGTPYAFAVKSPSLQLDVNKKEGIIVIPYSCDCSASLWEGCKKVQHFTVYLHRPNFIKNLNDYCGLYNFSNVVWITYKFNYIILLHFVR